MTHVNDLKASSGS